MEKQFLVTAGATSATTVYTLNCLVLLELCFWYSANTSRIKVGLLSLNTAKATELGYNIIVSPAAGKEKLNKEWRKMHKNNVREEGSPEMEHIYWYLFVALFLPLRYQVRISIVVLQ